MRIWRSEFAAMLAVAAFMSSAHASVHDRLYASGFEDVAKPANAGEAARFLTQATFGPVPADIARVMQVGYSEWIDEQMAGKSCVVVLIGSKTAGRDWVEYEFKNGNPAYYEVKVLRNDGQKLTKYELDPNSGKVKEVSDEKFEKLFTRIKPTAIQNAPTSLTRAITTAEMRSGGKAREAEVNRDGDQLQYEVKVVKADGTRETLKINGSDGKVASAR